MNPLRVHQSRSFPPFNFSRAASMLLGLPVFLAMFSFSAWTQEETENLTGSIARPQVKKILGKDVQEWLMHLHQHDTPEERHLAIYCLGDFGPKAVDALADLRKEFLQSKDVESRVLSVQALGMIGSAAASALPDLLSLLTHKDEPRKVRKTICESIARIAPQSPQVRKALLMAMRDGDLNIRHTAIDASVPLIASGSAGELLKELGLLARESRDAEPAVTALVCLGEAGVPTLIAALDQTRSDEARAIILDGARRLGPRARPAEREIKSNAEGGRFKRRSGKVRAAAMQALSAIDPIDRSHLDIFAAGLGEKEVTATAERMLTHSGTAALTVLDKPLRTKETEVVLAALRVLTSLGDPAADLIEDISSLLKHDNKEVVRAALGAIHVLGPSAVATLAVIREVEGSAKDRETKELARLAAANVSRSPTDKPIKQPIELLETAELISILRIENRKKSEPQERRQAAVVLRSRLSKEKDAAITEALVKALDDPATEVRAAAAKSLAFAGPEAGAATATLLEWLTGDNPELHEAALTTLLVIGPKDQSTMLSLVGFAQSNSAENVKTVRTLHGQALCAQGPEAATLLARSLKEPDARTRCRAALALESMGPVGLTALPDLLKIAEEDPDDKVAQAALQAIASFGPLAESATQPLVMIMAQGNATRRMAAGWALAGIGLVPGKGDPHHVIEILILNLLDSEESAARAAHTALVKIGEPALPAVRQILKVGKGEAPYWALRVLARMKDDPDTVIPPMLELTLPGKLPIERAVAVELLANYAPDQTRIIPTLVDVLGDRKEYVVHVAEKTLRLFGDKAIPELEKALIGPNAIRRKNALVLLEELR